MLLKMLKPKIFIWQGGSIGGAEKVMSEITRFLMTKYGVEVTVGVFRGEPKSLESVIYMEAPRLFPKKLVAYNTIAASLWLTRQLAKFDLVITHSGGFWKRGRARFVYREPGDLDALMQALPWRSKLIYWLPYLVALFSLKSSDLPIAASQKAGVFFQRHGIKDFVMSSNFIETDILPPTQSKEHVSGEIFNLAFVGRADRIKNVGLLIQLMDQLDNSYQLHLFGISGDNTRNIHYHGWVPETDIIDYLQQPTHVLLLPSLFEASPMVLLLALALGVPVLANAAAVPNELKDLVVTVNAGSDNWLSAIQTVASDYDKYKNASLEASFFVRQHYNTNQVLTLEMDQIFKQFNYVE